MFNRESSVLAGIAVALIAFASCGNAASLEGTATSAFSKIASLKAGYPNLDIWALDFSPNSAILAVASSFQVDIWDWRKNQILKSLSQPRGSNPGFCTNPVQYSPDGKLLALCGSKGENNLIVRVWNTRDWSIAKDIADSGAGDCNGLAFTSSGKQLACAIDRLGKAGDQLIVYDIVNWQIATTVRMDAFSPVAMAISPDGRTAAISGTLLIPPGPELTDPVERFRAIVNQPQIQLIDVASWKVIKVLRANAAGAVAWSPHNRRLAVVSAGNIEVLDTQTGMSLLDARERTYHMNALFSPDGRLFFDTDMNGKGTGRGLYVWDSSRKHLLQKIDGNISSVAISQDSRVIAVGGVGATTIWREK
jgi:WD40 repeat protein